MADNHIIVAGYAAGGYTKTRPAYQYDYGQELQLQGFPEGMLPASFEMHFSIGMGQAITRIGTNGAVAVPNACLERFGTLTAWLFLHDAETDGETKYVIEIPVRSRAKTTDQEPTPEEQSVITEAIAALNAGVTAAEAAQAAAEAAAESVGEAAEQAQGKAGEAAASATAAAGSAEAAAGSATSAAGAATSAGESASAAAGSATAASGSAEAAAGSATAAAGSAAAAAQTVAGIEEAGAAQVLAVNTAGAAKVDAINTAGTEKVNAINTAGTEKVNAINTAGTEKVNAVNTAGAAQVQAVEAKGEEVIEEIPADYSALSADVTNLKSAVSIGEYIYFTEGFVWSSSGALSANANYCASKQLMTIDPKKQWLKLSNYESDRVDLVFFNASGTFISPRQSLYNDSPLFINVVDKAPEGAAYFSVSIRKTTNKPYAKLITASEWVGEYNGYVDINGKICIGDSGNSKYMLKIASVQTGGIVKALSSANSRISVLAFYDVEFNFVKRISYLSADIYDYMAIAPCAGYVIASSTTVSFNDFAMSIEPFNNDDTDIVPDSHYPYYINNGAVTATETYYLSNCIVVPAGKVLMVSANCGTAAAVLSDGQTNANIAAGYGTTYDYWVSYYANETKIIRICWRPGYGDGLKAYTITPKKQLNGKRLLGIGDSYFAGNNLITDAYAKNHVWLNLLAMRNNMTIQNYGVNGTTISECSAMSGTGTNPDSSNVAISDRIDRITDAFDVIFFEGGRNDFSNGIPIGTIELSNADRTTFSGAVQYIINKIISLNAAAFVIGHPCWVSANGAEHSTTHLTQTDYMETFKKVCELNGVKCVDTKNNGIIVTQSNFRSMYFMTSSDVSHLNVAGHEKYVSIIETLFQ